MKKYIIEIETEGARDGWAIPYSPCGDDAYTYETEEAAEAGMESEIALWVEDAVHQARDAADECGEEFDEEEFRADFAASYRVTEIDEDDDEEVEA
jgi:hypothetical protein